MNTTRILIFLGMACGLALAGCSRGNRDLRGLVSGLMPPSPGQTARDAFNVYDADLRRGSVAALSAAPFGGEQPYVRTYRLLLDDPDPTVRAACANALGLHGEPEDVDRLIPRLADDVTFVRWEVAQALQKLYNPNAVRPLITALGSDPDADVRMASAAALGQYPDLRVFNALVGALEDQHYSVVVAAQQSLRTLTGADLGVEGSQWLTFQEERKTDLFTGGRAYTWQPYQRPWGTLDRMAFWKKKPAPLKPRLATGAAPQPTANRDYTAEF